MFTNQLNKRIIPLFLFRHILHPPHIPLPPSSDLLLLSYFLCLFFNSLFITTFLLCPHNSPPHPTITLSDVESVNNNNLQLLQNNMPSLAAPYHLFIMPVNINSCHHSHLHNHHQHHRAPAPRTIYNCVKVSSGDVWGVGDRTAPTTAG